MILVRLFLLVNLIFTLISFELKAQEEKEVREMMIGPLTTKEKKQRKDQLLKDEVPPRFELLSPLYSLDLNSDGFLEALSFSYKDGLPFIQIVDAYDKVRHEFPLQAIGKGAYPYKVRYTTLDKDYLLLLVFFYQGFRTYLNRSSQSRLYFLTWKRKKILSTFQSFEGPVIWEEEQGIMHRYRQKAFDVSLKDLNNDGRREVILTSGKIKRVYIYPKGGPWKSL